MVFPYGSHFEFDGESSRKYGLVFANINSNLMKKTSISSDAVKMFSKRNNKQYLVGEDFSSSAFSFEVEIVTRTGRCFNAFDRKTIEKWLFNRRGYHQLYFDMADDVNAYYYTYVDGVLKRAYMNCRFINPEKIEGNGGLVGYRVTIETDSYVMWQDSVTKKFTLSDSGVTSESVIEVCIDTDTEEYLYPNVLIETGNYGGNISVENNSDIVGRLTRFVGLPANATISMNGEFCYVSDEYYPCFAGGNFIRLLDGKNCLKIVGDVKSISFEYTARKVL